MPSVSHQLLDQIIVIFDQISNIAQHIPTTTIKITTTNIRKTNLNYFRWQLFLVCFSLFRILVCSGIFTWAFYFSFHHLCTRLRLSIRDILIMNRLFRMVCLFRCYFLCFPVEFLRAAHILISFCLNTTEQNHIDSRRRQGVYELIDSWLVGWLVCAAGIDKAHTRCNAR